MSTHLWTEDAAASYDASSAAMFAPEVLGPAVDFLAARAEGGAVLELAVGTGRAALALADRCVPVHGVELSEPMAARLAAKPGADRVPVTIGDTATATAPGRFRLVYLVFNGITNLLTQDAQVACFASHHYGTAPDGTVTTGRSPHRYVWPAELDLMARLAGMTPTERWADFDESPFTAESPSHVSVWRTPA